MIGSNHDTFSLPSKIVYQRVHAALSGALREIGIATVLTEANAPKLSEACFANPVVSDVIENGRKIAGAAQRKTRSGLLHQGSIQRQNMNGKFRSIFGKLLTKRLITNSIEMGVLGSAKELAVAKYATDAWLRRR
jgi:lipoate-protein ligase A